MPYPGGEVIRCPGTRPDRRDPIRDTDRRAAPRRTPCHRRLGRVAEGLVAWVRVAQHEDEDNPVMVQPVMVLYCDRCNLTVELRIDVDQERAA